MIGKCFKKILRAAHHEYLNSTLRNQCLLFHFILFFVILINACSPSVKSPRIDVDIASCRQVLDFFRTMKSESDRSVIEAELDALLDTKAYRTMFTHYNRSWRPNHLPPDVFKRMILSLKYADAYTAGENRRADQMLPKWTSHYADLDRFETHVDELEELNLQQLINEAIDEAHGWLPEEMHIDDFYFFIHPNGGSGGFAIGDAQGYDFFQLARDESDVLQTRVLKEIAAHECHHLALEIPRPGFQAMKDSLTFEFLCIFVGEGTATKFINNTGGGAVPRIDPERSNTMMDPGTNPLTKPLWQQYTANLTRIFGQMETMFMDIHNGKMSEEAYDEQMRKYWITGMIGRNYFIGSEIFGAIYHGLGKEAAFDAIRDPRRMFDLYNRAVGMKPDLLGACPTLSAETVKCALDL